MKLTGVSGAFQGSSRAVLPAALASRAVAALGPFGPAFTGSAVAGASVSLALTGALVEDPELFADSRVLRALTASSRQEALAVRAHLNQGETLRAASLMGATAGRIAGSISGAALATSWALDHLSERVLAQAAQLPLPPQLGPWLPLLVRGSCVAAAQVVGASLGGAVGSLVGRASAGLQATM